MISSQISETSSPFQIYSIWNFSAVLDFSISVDIEGIKYELLYITWYWLWNTEKPSINAAPKEVQSPPPFYIYSPSPHIDFWLFLLILATSNPLSQQSPPIHLKISKEGQWDGLVGHDTWYLAWQSKFYPSGATW